MEYSAGDSTSKDEAMKKSFESSADDSEKKKTKSKKKQSILTPDEKSVTEAKDKVIDTKAEKKVKSGLFEVLGLEKVEGEKEKPPEKIEPAETIEATSQYVETNKPDAEAELRDAPVGSVEETAAAASVVFLEQLEQKLESSDEVDESLLEQVVTETLEDLDIEPSDSNETEEPELPAETESTDDSEEDDQSNTNVNSSQSTATVTHPTTPPPPTPNTPIQPPTPPSQPPSPPSPPVQPPNGPPPNNPNNTPQNHGGPGNLNVAPILTTPNTVNATDAEFNHRRRRAADLLVGGVVGYLVGRRRGRINTERKLLPIQKNLENEVKQLHKMIADKELEVRRRAANSFENRPPTVEKRSEKVVEVRTKAEQKPKMPIKEPETVNELEYKDHEFVVEHDDPAIINERVESKSEYGEHAEKKLTRKTIETISLPLLLEIAADIKLGDVSLRTMFEKGTVDQKNLRKIVKQYMNGEKLEKIWPEALSKDIIGEEFRQDVSVERQQDGATVAPHTDDQDDKRTQPAVNKSDDNWQDFSHKNTADDVESSRIVNSILYDDNKEKKTSPAKLIGFMLAAVVAAVIIISIFS